MAGSVAANNNKGPEMEYWSHQRQWLESSSVSRKLTASVEAVGTGAEENLIPTFKNDANKTLITSAGQTVYLHCQVENLGERSVSFENF
jgi:hypothetical protein